MCWLRLLEGLGVGVAHVEHTVMVSSKDLLALVQGRKQAGCVPVCMSPVSLYQLPGTFMSIALYSSRMMMLYCSRNFCSSRFWGAAI